MRNPNLSYIVFSIVALLAMACIQIEGFPPPPDGAIKPDAQVVDLFADDSVADITIGETVDGEAHVDIADELDIGGDCTACGELDIYGDGPEEELDIHDDGPEDCQEDCLPDDPCADPCEDDNPCTTDSCLDGECVFEWLTAEDLEADEDLEIGDCLCDSNEDCTGNLENGDLCDGTLYCDDSGETAVCAIEPETVKEDPDDNDPCNGLETCDPETGETVAGEPLEIDDEDACTEDSCDPDAGQVNTPIDCDDENPCTDDSCDPADGCVHEGNDMPCDDDNECTSPDTCGDGACVGGPLLDCDDDNPCTDDSCDPVDGCANTDNELDCDDENECTTADACLAGVCTGGPPLECDDENICTDDSCDPVDGSCTDDSCDIENGCQHDPNDAPCDNDDPCTLDDTCSAGVCSPGTPNPLCEDFDHDGLGLNDSCPYAFDPQELDLDDNGSPDACEPLGEGFASTRPIELSQAGAKSTWRRTNEPVEIPLANGIIDDSVVAYYPLDGDGNDLGAVGNDGELLGGVSFGDGPGPGSTAAYFDGTGRILAAHSAELNFGQGNFSFMVWMRHEELTELDGVNGHIAFGFREGDKGIGLEMYDKTYGFHGKPYLWLYGDSGDCTSGPVVSSERIDDNKWHHLAVVRTGPTTIQIHIDGNLSATHTIGACSIGSNSAPFVLGHNMAEEDKGRWEGGLDDLVIFNRALTPDEFESYYASKAPYGTQYADGAQADFDDVRVTETADDNSTYVTRSRVIGVRPHSDTPCPMDEDDGTWADREGLCGVVGYWKLDGDAADTLAANDASVSGATPGGGRFGASASALAFDGLSNKLVVAASPTLDAIGTGNQSFTVEAWGQIATSASCGGKQKVLFSKTNGPAGGTATIELGVDTECRAYAYAGVSPTGSAMPTAQAPLSSGVWHHFAVVRDIVRDSFVLYVDGFEVAAVADDFGDMTSSGFTWIGASADAGGQQDVLFWAGKIDEVLIHNVAKSPDYIYHRARPGVPKVRFLANTETTNGGTDDAPEYAMRDYALHWGDADATTALPFVGGPAEESEPCYGLLNGCLGYAGWWRFDEGSGTVATDSSSWKNNGEISGAKWSAEGTDNVSLSFNGSSDKVSVGDSDSLHVAALTVEFGVEFDGFTEQAGSGIVDKTDYQGNTGFYVSASQNPDNGFFMGINDDGYVHKSADVPGTGEWMRFAAAYSESGSTSWRDYEVLNSAGAGPAIQHNSGDMLFGLDTTPGPLGLNGSLENVRLMNRALPPDELLHYPLADWAMECIPSCGGNVCGSDGCGGVCDACGAGKKCTSFGACVTEEAIVVPGDHATLQEAVDAAQDGDVIAVGPGTYDGGIEVAGKSLDFVATDGAEETTIEWDGNADEPYGFYFTSGGTSTVSGFTLLGDECQNNKGFSYGIRVIGSQLTVEKCFIKGFGIGTTYDKVSSGTFKNNIVTVFNLGFMCDEESTCGVYHNVFAHSTGDCDKYSVFTKELGTFSYGNATTANNIFYDLGKVWEANAVFGAQWGKISFANSLAFLIDANNLPEDQSNLQVDPLFVDAAADKFELKGGSPALDAGLTIEGVLEDCVGTTRPQGSGPDIGPYEALDGDHDGLSDLSDSCPYAFDPQEIDLDEDGNPDGCEPLGDGFSFQRTIALSQGGAASTWRRTNEPVEIPLANGILDDSVVGYWKLDGDHSEESGIGVEAELGSTPAVGAFGDPDGAFTYDGTDDGAQVWKDRDFRFGDQFTVQLWARTSSLQEAYWASVSSGDKCHDKGWFIGQFDQGLMFGATDGSALANLTCDTISDGKLHHVAGVRSGSLYQLFVDGRLCGSETVSGMSAEYDCGNMLQIAHRYHFQTQQTVNQFNGSLDDLVIFNRALSPDEIDTYYRSSAPYGTSFAPGAQADFDDVRITETGDDDSTFVTRSRVIGVRPHSDSPCPMDEDDGSWADREDLCGVAAYWPLDGDVNDLVGGIDGVGTNTSEATGRFADPGGALQFDGLTSYVDTGYVFSPDADDSFTVEAWVRLDAPLEYKNGMPEPGDHVFGYWGDTGAKWGTMKLLVHSNDVNAVLREDSNDVSVDIHVSESIGAGEWHHFAVQKDGKKKKWKLYMDGLLLSSISDSSAASNNAAGLKFFIGAVHGSDGNGPHGHLEGAVDEVIIHNVAKSADYIYNRANPGVPKLRFLANTAVENHGSDDAPAYPMRDYALHWGAADATTALPFVSSLDDAPEAIPETCYGLLNGCLGYAGWWRFNEDGGDVALDSSGWKSASTASNLDMNSGAEGLAGDFNGSTSQVKSTAVPALAGKFTVEASISPRVINVGEADQVVRWGYCGDGCGFSIYKGENGQFPGVEGDDWILHLHGSGGNNSWLWGGKAVADSWAHLSATYDGTVGSMYSNGYLSESSATMVYKPVLSDQVVRIGSRADDAQNTNEAVDGLIDSVRIMNRALTSDEFLHYPLVDWSLGD